jgi:hypothetical protein
MIANQRVPCASVNKVDGTSCFRNSIDQASEIHGRPDEPSEAPAGSPFATDGRRAILFRTPHIRFA